MLKDLKVGVFAMLFSASSLSASAQDISLKQSDYTIPTWTQLQRVIAGMQKGTQPYSINMTINGDPTTRMAFAWFTNPNVKSGKVQIVAKANATAEDFANPTHVFDAISAEVKDLNYVIAQNYVEGVEVGTKKSYTSHKALATGLIPATTYSFRLGNENG